MSRKDFIALANALRTTNASDQTILAVAEVCATTNPRFDRERFLAAIRKEA